jgi:AraC family transcriptional regulator of arabinose operon
MEDWPTTLFIRLNNAPRFHRCEPGWQWSPPPLTDYDLWWVLEGRGQIILNGENIELRPGRCFILKPGTEIRATQDPAFRLLVFAAHFEPRDSASLTGFPLEGQFVQDREFLEIMARHCENFFQRGDPSARLQSAGLVQQILLKLWDELEHPQISAADRNIGQIIQTIRLEPGRSWKVAEMARQAGLSRSQFTRRFQKVAGVSPNSFVIHSRLDRARQLLLETDMDLASIAEALGYQDIYFFSRQFKAVTGFAPSHLRNSARQAALITNLTAKI